MKRFNEASFRKDCLKELLDSEGFLGTTPSERLKESSGFFLGLRNGSVVFDLERSLTTFIKVLQLIKGCHSSSAKILFVGCPHSIEHIVQKELSKSRHTFISENSWVLGSLTNYNQSKIRPDLIVTFNRTCTFPSKECFKKDVPLISFVDETFDITYVDYPIFVNLKSKGAAKMYYQLIKQCISNV
jgi:ribosomal protein S2